MPDKFLRPFFDDFRPINRSDSHCISKRLGVNKKDLSTKYHDKTNSTAITFFDLIQI